MATTITAGATTIAPIQVEGYSAARTGGTLVHQILARQDPDVSLRPAGMRAGTLTLLFATEATAAAAVTALSAAGAFTLASTDRTSIAMRFVVPSGQQLTIALDDVTRNHWHVSVPFQEVAP